MMAQTKDFINAFDPYGSKLLDAAQRALGKQDARTRALAQTVASLPKVRPSHVNTDRAAVTIGLPADLTTDQSEALEKMLMDLKPWRKGPFNLYGIEVDSEWNSDLKWQRVAPHIKPLGGRKVLDVGSSNGYYLFRMAAAKPRLALGIEPYSVYYYQYLALQRYLDLPATYCLPLRMEDLPDMNRWFDTLFCMGILYHRRSPLDTLTRMKHMLSPKGQLILETLIIPGEEETALCPRDRYARMRNVFFIPTVNCLKYWLQRCGFHNVQCVGITPTTLEEQRKTPWIDSDSLDTFLDPVDNSRTVEGYPAPVRAIMIAEPK